MHNYTEVELEEKIKELENSIQAWAKKEEMWHDCGFKSYSEYVDGEPLSPAVVTVFHADNHILFGEITEYADFDISHKCRKLIDDLGYWVECQTHYKAYFYAKDDKLNEAFEEYFHWKWVSSLVQEDIGDLYEEMYEYFFQNPDKLHNLSPREYEVMLSRIFQNQGYETILGPGSGDGGVDLRLIHREPLGDIVTLVQAKRYAKHRKINLTPVQALRGVMAEENVKNGIFITTSDYLPSTKRFANNSNSILQLKKSSDVAEWCNIAKNLVIEDKSKLISPEYINKVILNLGNNHEGHVVYATDHYGVRMNHFAIVVKETNHSALLMKIKGRCLSGKGYQQIGEEVPDLNENTYLSLNKENVFRAKIKRDTDGSKSYWDGKNLFYIWDNMPVHYDWVD